VRWPIKLETHSTHAGTSELLPASSKCCTSPLGLASPGEWQQLCSTNVPATTKRPKFHAEVAHKGPLKDGRRLAQAIGLSFAATFCPSRGSFGHPAITVTWNHRASLSLAFAKARDASSSTRYFTPGNVADLAVRQIATRARSVFAYNDTMVRNECTSVYASRPDLFSTVSPIERSDMGHPPSYTCSASFPC